MLARTDFEFLILVGVDKTAGFNEMWKWQIKQIQHC
jgi:hypothetical protein